MHSAMAQLLLISPGHLTTEGARNMVILGCLAATNPEKVTVIKAR